jgi:hypothetical protein
MISSTNPAVAYHPPSCAKMASPMRRITPESIDDVLSDSDVDSESSFYTKKPAAIPKQTKDDPNANHKRSNFNARKSVATSNTVLAAAAPSPVRSDPVLASLKRTIEFPLSKEKVPDLQVIPRSSDEEDNDDDMISPADGKARAVPIPDVQPKRLSLESASSFEETEDNFHGLENPAIIPGNELDLFNAASLPSVTGSTTSDASSGNKFQPSVSELVKLKARKIDMGHQKPPTAFEKRSKAKAADSDCAISLAPLPEDDAQPNDIGHSIQHWREHIAPVLQYCGVCAPCKEKPCGQCRLCNFLKGKRCGRVSDGQSRSKTKVTFSYCMFKCCVRHYKEQNSHTWPVIQWYRDELDYTRGVLEQQLIEESKLGPKYFRFQVDMPVYCWWPDSQVRRLRGSCCFYLSSNAYIVALRYSL